MDFSNREIMSFLDMITTSKEIQALMHHDVCFRIVDNYLLALVFIFFKRAQLKPEEFSDVFFFLALLLAHDIVEEDEQIVEEIKYFILPCQRNDYSIRKKLEYVKFLMFQEMDYRGYVSHSACEKVMSAVPHPLWERKRDATHGGTFHATTLMPGEQQQLQYDWYSSSCSKCRAASAAIMEGEEKLTAISNIL